MAHWGAFEAESDGDDLRELRPHPLDPNPSALLGNIPAAMRHRSRVVAPMVRAGWLDRGPGPDEQRGAEPFVPLDWDDALDLLAAELARVRDRHGNRAIFAGSYGWGSHGRFHHARTHLQRFLVGIGGFTSSVHTYSVGASEVLLPHVVGSFAEVLYRAR
jgi:biotin/methionine sulfoxide reductase